MQAFVLALLFPSDDPSRMCVVGFRLWFATWCCWGISFPLPLGSFSCMSFYCKANGAALKTYPFMSFTRPAHPFCCKATGDGAHKCPFPSFPHQSFQSKPKVGV